MYVLQQIKQHWPENKNNTSAYYADVVIFIILA